MSTYRIGNFANGVAGVQDIENLTGTPPHPTDFLEFSEASAIALSGKPVESGYARALWKWSYLPQQQFNNLVNLCTGSSAEVYMTTRVNSGTAYSFGLFRATMLRPTADTVPGNLRASVKVAFLNLRSPL